MAKKVLAINLGWEQERLLRLLVEQGCEVIGAHPDDSFAPDLGIAQVERLDVRDIQGLLRLARSAAVDAVVCDQDDYAYFSNAVICESLGLPGPRLCEAQVATNKYWQRRAAQNAGIRQPEFHLCACVEDARAAMRQIADPVVVKPVDNRGAFGVTRVDEEQALAEACHTAVMFSHSRMFLVERYIRGTNIIIDGYVFPQSGHRSLALGSKSMSAHAVQLAEDIVYPGQLSKALCDKACAINDSVVEALGFRFGMTSGEFIIDDQEDIWLVEIANRGGGVYIAPIVVPAISGVDVTWQLIYDALGLRRDLAAEADGAAARTAAYLKYFMLPPGRVAAVRGLESASAMPGVAAFKFLGDAGDEFVKARHAGERQGLIITLGGDVKEARERASAAFNAVEVVYD